MRKSRKKKHRIESSKKIVIFCDALTTLTIVMTFIGWFFGHDLSGMDVIVPAVIGLSAAAHSFYYWKAKAENMKKFGMQDTITMDNGGNGYD